MHSNNLPQQDRHQHVTQSPSRHENTVGNATPKRQHFAAKNLPPLVEVSLDSDIALDKDKATPHPTHHGKPHQEPDGNFCKALQGKTSQKDFLGAI